MYGEFFDIPPPDELVFISSFTGGEVFRSGCCFLRGKGRIFFFSPGHEHFPVYHHARRAAGDRERRALGSRRAAVAGGHFDVRRVAEGLVRRAGMTTFRIAVVGTGSISRFWLPLLRDRPDVDVVALVDVDAEVARAAAERDGVSAPIFRTLETRSRGDRARRRRQPDSAGMAPAGRRDGARARLPRPRREADRDDARGRAGARPRRRGSRAYLRRDAEPPLRARDPNAARRPRRRSYRLRDDARLRLLQSPAFRRLPRGDGKPTAPRHGNPPVRPGALPRRCRPRRSLLSRVQPRGLLVPRADAAAICIFELADGSVFSYRGSWSAEGFGTSWNGSWRVVGTAGTALWDGEGDPVAEIAHSPGGAGAAVPGRARGVGTDVGRPHRPRRLPRRDAHGPRAGTPARDRRLRQPEELRDGARRSDERARGSPGRARRARWCRFPKSRAAITVGCLERDPLPAHTVRSATVGGIRDARTAGIRPANAPIRMAEAMPPVHASTGITMAQFFELA